jgi:F-type H+-transporting ATPase subunit b
VKKLLFALALTAGAIYAQEKETAAEKKEAAEVKDELLVWKWANFVIIVGAGGYFLSKHLPAYFGGRTADIQKDITEAQAQKAAAEKRSAEMDARLASLGAEVEKFRAEAKAEMAMEAARIRQETGQLIEKIQKQAEQEIESAGTLASRELKAYAARLSLDLAEQRIRTRLDAGTEAGLVEDFTGDLQKQGSKN